MQETIESIRQRIVDSLTFMGQNAMVQDFLIKQRLIQPHAMWWYKYLLEDFEAGKRDLLVYAAAERLAQRELWHDELFDPNRYNPIYQETT